MVRLPRVKRTRRLEQGAVALVGLDFRCDRGNDLVADLVEDDERVVQRVIEGLDPDDPRTARFGQLDGYGAAVAVRPNGSADHIVDVEDPARFLRANATLMQCEHGPLRDDEEASQPGEPADYVVRQRVSDPAVDTGRCGVVHEGHDRDRAAARCHCSGVIAAVDRARVGDAWARHAGFEERRGDGLGDRQHEPIAPAGDGGDRLGADHLAQARHLHRQVVLLHDSSRPCRQQRLVLGDHAVAMRDQAQQQVERTRAQLGRHSVVQQQPFCRPDLEAAESQGVLQGLSSRIAVNE